MQNSDRVLTSWTIDVSDSGKCRERSSLWINELLLRSYLMVFLFANKEYRYNCTALIRSLSRVVSWNQWYFKRKIRIGTKDNVNLNCVICLITYSSLHTRFRTSFTAGPKKMRLPHVYIIVRVYIIVSQRGFFVYKQEPR